MNPTIEDFTRAEIKSVLAQLSEKHHHVFRLMYSHPDLTKDINQVVDDMPVEKLDWALSQAETSLAKLRGGGSEPQRYNSVDGSMDSNGSLVSLADYRALESRLAEKTKALEFYANPENWESDNTYDPDKYVIAKQDREWVKDHGEVGGKIAREALKERG